MALRVPHKLSRPDTPSLTDSGALCWVGPVHGVGHSSLWYARKVPVMESWKEQKYKDMLGPVGCCGNSGRFRETHRSGVFHGNAVVVFPRLGRPEFRCTSLARAQDSGGACLYVGDFHNMFTSRN